MISATSPDDLRALVHLYAPLGQPGSGRQRYGAAMHFNSIGKMSDAALEVYRICSPLDGEDPASLLGERCLLAEMPVSQPVSGELAIRMLVDEADRYFATLSGPGISEARSGLSLWQNGSVSPHMHEENAVIDEWLPAALEQLAESRPMLAATISMARPYLKWLTYDDYPVEDVGVSFAKGHAYAATIGEDAVIPAIDWEMGLFLIPPQVLYRDHKHLAPELYAPLTGPHGWRFGADEPLVVLPAHRPVWNDPFRPHLTKVGPVPFLCLYVWTRDVNAYAQIVPAADWARLEAFRLGL